MEDLELEFKLDFLAESEDLLENVEGAFLKLDSNRDDKELLNEIFRLAHNLKGTSQAVGFDQLSELTHVTENLILKLKQEVLSVTDSVVSVLLEFKDKITEMVEGLKEDISATFEIENLISKIQKELSGENSVENVEETKNISESPVEKVTNNDGPELSDAALESLRELGINDLDLKEESAEEIEEVPKESQLVKAKEPSQGENTQSKVNESIRVGLSKINSLNNIIGELIILQTVVSQRRYEYIEDELTNKSISMMGKLFKEAQELSMSLRMLPLKATFQKMTRIVRDTSKLLDKDVHLNLIGEETEVDKTVLEKLADPLVHIIRNAVDHGLESSEERLKLGKDKIGTVEIMAFHEGSNLVIQITDDGKGIDPEKIRKKALEKGIISNSSNISDQELIQLIFHPGFSTKEEVTEVSGRGVGMDVVRTNIESLGGEIKLRSKVNQGSSLKISLPLTLAIIDGIVINSDDDKFVLPLSQVYEMVQVKNNEIESFSGVAKLFDLRGEVLPLFHLNKKVGNSIKESDSYTVVVVRGLSHAFGVIVDDVVNQQQIVVKNLGEDVRRKNGIVGSAIMSDGMPSLILDLFELFRNDVRDSKGYQNFLNKNREVA